MATRGDIHSRHGGDHDDSDDVSVGSVSDTLSHTTADDEPVEWEDWDEAVDGSSFVCMLCPASFGSSEEVWDHCIHEHSFDFIEMKKKMVLDMYSTMKLINYIRKLSLDNPGSVDIEALKKVTIENPLFKEDTYLHPTLEDDALLYELNCGDDNGSNFSDDDVVIGDMNELLIRLKNAEKRAMIAEQRAEQLESVVMEYRTLTERLISEKEISNGVVSTHQPEEETSSKEVVPATSKEVVPIEVDDAGISAGYFSSYAHFGIHMSMLKDAVRTDSYRDAIYLNKDMFQDKVVLDVGCGTGILSMFAAKSGAKKVIGIDRSDIVMKAQQIVKKNKLDHIVTIIRGEVEKVVLPVDKVDIIISEWMGYFLLYESMLDTVLFARDKWLAPGGVVQPSMLQMVICAAALEFYHEDNVLYWRDVYGFDMECMRGGVLKEAQVDVVHADEIISSTSLLRTFDIINTKKEEQEFLSPFTLNVTQAGPCCAFVSYFDTEFKWNSPNSTTVEFSTGPNATPTHWKQTIFLLEEPIKDLKVGDVIKGNMTCRRNPEYYRSLEMFIEWHVESEGIVSTSRSQNFQLG